MSETVTAADGVRLAVETTGSGTPVVFVHGSNGGLDSWSEVADLIDGVRVVRYARRNHAPSDEGGSPNTFAAEVGDLRAVLAAVTDGGATPAHVVGGSYGATIALHAAVDRVAGIASLALFEPPVLLVGPHLLPVLDEYRKLCAAERFADALTLFVREVARIPSDVLESGPPVPDSRTHAIGSGADLEAMASDTDDVGRFAVIDVPVLLMSGALSWAPLPEGMDRLAAALPHAERVTWPDQSHFATATVPDRVAEAIGRFIDAR